MSSYINDNDNDNEENEEDNIYDLDETSLKLIYKSSQKECTDDEINLFKKKTLQEELDEKKNKIINKNEKKIKVNVKNIIDISINNKSINNRQFNPRLPPFNLIKK